MNLASTICTVAVATTLSLCGPALASPPAITSPLLAEPLDEGRGSGGQIINTDEFKRPEPSLREAAPAGNPLWAIPLVTLMQTRERPLFTPSRRPPAPAIARTLAPAPRQLPKPVVPEVPRLTLVGTIVGNEEGFGLFIDASTKAVVRLKTGSAYQGWMLRSVREREVVLEKNYLSTTLSLPTHEHREPIAAQRPRSVDGRGQY